MSRGRLAAPTRDRSRRRWTVHRPRVVGANGGEVVGELGYPLGLPPGHAGPPPDADAVREAFEQVRAGWAAVGVR